MGPGAPGDGGVGAVVQVDANLIGFARNEPAPEGFPRAGRQGDLDAAVAALDQGPLRRIGSVNIRLAIDQPVIFPGSLAQMIASISQRPLQALPALGREGRGLAGYCHGNHGVGDPLLQVQRDRVPRFPVDHRQQAPVHLLRRPHEVQHRRIIVGEPDGLGVELPNQHGDPPVQPGEGPVAIGGDRFPDYLIADGERSPFHVVGMTVPVSDQEIHKARAHVGRGVDVLAGIVAERIEQVVATDEGCCSLHWRQCPFDGPQDAAEFFAELSEGRVIGHDVHGGTGMGHAGRVEQRRRDEGGGGVQGAHLVLQHPLDDRLSQAGGKRLARRFLDRAEFVGYPVASLHMQAERLAPAALLQRLQAAGVMLEIEDRHADLGGPETPVVRAQGDFRQPDLVAAIGNHRIDDDGRRRIGTGHAGWLVVRAGAGMRRFSLGCLRRGGGDRRREEKRECANPHVWLPAFCSWPAMPTRRTPRWSGP